MADEDIAVILYGHGAELGDFRLFADDTFAELLKLKKFKRTRMMIQETLNRASFFRALSAFPAGFKIKELHVYSHSMGGGIYVGYHEPMANAVREAAARRYLGRTTKISYDEVLDAEVGGILGDHLLRDPSTRTTTRPLAPLYRIRTLPRTTTIGERSIPETFRNRASRRPWPTTSVSPCMERAAVPTLKSSVVVNGSLRTSTRQKPADGQAPRRRYDCTPTGARSTSSVRGPDTW